MTLDEIKAVIDHRRNVYLKKKAKWEARVDWFEFIEEIQSQEHTLTALDYLEGEFERKFEQPTRPDDVTP